jgi:hypothetical protein
MATQVGVLAIRMDVLLPLQVLESNAGFYLGTSCPTEGPMTRESEEYWTKREQAEGALASGDWTQRHHF